MWEESGQSLIEAALVLGALAGAFLLAAPLVAAWTAREESVRAVIELPLP